jgi:dynein heavy chain 1
MLQRFNRYPLVIDPSGQATQFLQRMFADRKMQKTSFLDPAFMKHLESALRFGTPLLVQDVETLDPVLNPVLNREFHRTGGRVLVRVGDQDIDFSPTFTMFLTTRDPTCQFTPDLCSRVTFVNFTVTPASLESQCLSQVLMTERPDVDEKRSNMLKLQGEFQAKLRDLEDKLLEALNEAQGNILDDDSVMQTLETLKLEAAQVQAEVDRTEEVMLEISATCNIYQPMAVSCSRIYFAMARLCELHFLYHFSLQFFLEILTSVLSRSGDEADGTKSKGSQARLSMLQESLYRLAFERVGQGVRQEDQLVLALRLAQIKLRNSKEEPLEEEYDFLFRPRPASALPSEDALNLARMTFPSGWNGGVNEAQHRQLGFLFSLSGFKSVVDSMSSNPSIWRDSLCNKISEPEKNIRDIWNEEMSNADEAVSNGARAEFLRILLLKVLRPDRFVAACDGLACTIFGAQFLSSAASKSLHDFVTEVSHCRSPLLLSSTSGFDASEQVDALAMEMGKIKKYKSVSMGSAEGFELADRCITAAVKSGSWVLLRNIHLCPAWLRSLEKRLYSIRPAEGFRLFLTADVHPSIPVNLVRLSHVKVFEPPAGVKASLKRSLARMPEARMMKGPPERARLYLLLSWFHAVVLERRRFSPVGWTKRYEFGMSDMKCALDAIDEWVDTAAQGKSHVKPENIPWKALRTLLAQTFYGGRIDNRFDDSLLLSFVDSLFVPQSFDADFKLSPVVTAPEGCTKADFVQWVKALPDTNNPEWLGLPASAQTRQLEIRGRKTLMSLLRMQGQVGEEDDDDHLFELVESARQADDNVGVEGKISDNGPRLMPPWMKKASSATAEWSQMLPTTLSSLERRPKSINNPLFRSLEREVNIASSLLKTLHRDMDDIRDMVAGNSKLTNRCRSVMLQVSRGELPREWSGRYPVARCNASEWIADFIRRLNQLASLTKTPIEDRAWADTPIWLGGLFTPEAFVTATRQAVAQSNGCSLEDLRLDVTLHSDPFVGDGGKTKDNIFLVENLRIEGAQWKDGSKSIELSEAMSQAVGPVRLAWVQGVAPSITGFRYLQMPVYLNSDRNHLLFTVSMRSADDIDDASWRQRGTAILAWNLE